MARKKKHPEHVNHERWLVSYADFITLLFAFFVVMFAVSQVDSKKVGRFTQSFNEALEWQVLTENGGGHGSGDKMIPELSAVSSAPKKKIHEFSLEKDAIRKSLAQRLGHAPVLAGLTVLEVRGELVLRLPEKLMFDRGEAILSQDGKAALDAIVDELRSRPVRVRVEGHTDSTPIHNSRFPSNWELSMSRAMAVVAFFLETGKIEPGRMAAAGYGEHHPIASNDTTEGRAQNRRVDLIVVAEFEHSEPTAAPAASDSAAHEADAAPVDSAHPREHTTTDTAHGAKAATVPVHGHGQHEEPETKP
jgi:chemotaxis protein MotB